jgi:PIN domain nuclease of toxin-antitoxin system
MRLLLDTNILITLIEDRLHGLEPTTRRAITDSESALFASAASLWEIAIKSRLGKLLPAVSPVKVPQVLRRSGCELLVIDHRHVLATVEPTPPTRDPFDYLLLAQCLVENLRLVTIDRALVTHPLAWRASD